MPDPTTDKLAAAKAALAKANNFTKSAEGKSDGMYAKKPSPYRAVYTERKAAATQNDQAPMNPDGSISHAQAVHAWENDTVEKYAND